GVRFSAAEGGGIVLGSGAFGTLANVVDVAAQLLKFVLTNGELQAESGKLSLCVLMLVSGANDFAFGFALASCNVFQSGFGLREFGGDALHFGLHFAHMNFERGNLGVESAQFTLHTE